jgi:RNA polymerase sigma-70 factor (ECF subfamily)
VRNIPSRQASARRGPRAATTPKTPTTRCRLAVVRPRNDADGAAASNPSPSTASARDRELVAGILEGSRAHFDELYSGYFQRIYRFALKRLSDPAEAEDVTQEVFETIFKVLPSYRGDSSLLVWIFGITRNKVNRRFRGARPRIESMDDAHAESLAAEQAPTDLAVDARRMLDRCDSVITDQLTPLQRRIFHLKHLRRQPIRDIAVALGKSEDAIKANLYRMRRALVEGAPGLEAFLGS